MVSSFFVGSVFDTTAGILVFVYALTQGLLPKPPELPDLPAFEIAFWAQHPSFLLFTITALGIAIVIAFALLARRVEAFWDRVKQGVVILTDPRRYLRKVAAWQGVGWLLRFVAFWFFLEAFDIGGSFGNVMLVMSVQAIVQRSSPSPRAAPAPSRRCWWRPWSAQARSPSSPTRSAQQIAMAAWSAILGFAGPHPRLPHHRLAPPAAQREPGGGAARDLGRRVGGDSPAPRRLVARRE